MKNLYKAYDRINVSHEERTKRLYGQLDKLLEISNSIESDLLRQLKPTVALSIKWRFDLLTKTMESPFEI